MRERGEPLRGRLRERDGGRGEFAPVVCERGRVLDERRGRVDVDRGRPGDRREDEHRRFEVAVERGGVGPRFAAERLVAAERADRLDGVVGGVRPGEDVEATRDENGRGEHLEVGRDVAVARGGGPRFVVRQRPRQPEPLVDELDAGGSLRDRVDVHRRAERSGAEEREHGRCHRSVVQSVVECIAETWRFDVGQCLARGIANPRGIVH